MASTISVLCMVVGLGTTAGGGAGCVSGARGAAGGAGGATGGAGGVSLGGGVKSLITKQPINFSQESSNMLSSISLLTSRDLSASLYILSCSSRLNNSSKESSFMLSWAPKSWASLVEFVVVMVGAGAHAGVGAEAVTSQPFFQSRDTLCIFPVYDPQQA